jgi:CBS domain-containing protein
MSDETRVRDVMTTELLAIEQNQKLGAAEEMMRTGRVRHVLVVDEDGALQGVLSQRDVFHGGLLKALGYGTHARQQALDGLRVKDGMTAQPITTSPDTLLREAAQVMVNRKISCLPVLEGDRLVGILTEGDLVLLIAGQKRAAGVAA